MRVLVQWAQRNPRDWVPIDSAAWANLPDLGVPGRGVLGGQNNALGWVNRLCVQGVHFPHDHYAVEDISGTGGIRVTTWHEDPDDYPPDEFLARVWTFLPLAPDSRFGGAVNTRQSQTLYAAPTVHERLSELLPMENAELRTWEEFEAVRPTTDITRHGVNLTDSKYAEHTAAIRSVHWREWS